MQSFTIIATMFLVLIHNLVSSNIFIMFLESLLAFLLFYYGSLRITLTDITMIDYFKENISTSLINIFVCFISAFILKVIMDFFKNDTIKELLLKISY